MFKINYKYEKCEICEKAITSSRSLATHVRYNHKELLVEDYYLKYVYRLIEPPKCPICKEYMKWQKPSRGFSCTRSCVTKYRIITNPDFVESMKRGNITYKEKMNEIDPVTGKTKKQLWSEKIQKKLDEPIDETGITIRKLKERKHSETLKKIDSETGLTIAQKYCKKSVKTKFNTLDRSGRNVFQIANDKIKEKAYADIDFVTGLNRFQRVYTKCKGNNEYRRKELTIQNIKFINLQGFEPLAIKYLVICEDINPKEINENPKYIKYFDSELNKNRIYYPDFKIQDTIYEVKSKYTYKTSGQNLIDKINAVRSKFNMRIMIMDYEGNLIENQFYPRIH